MKRLSIALALIVLVVTLPGLAPAGATGNATVTMFQGTMEAAQGPGACGSGSPGLGLPIVHGSDKTGSYEIGPVAVIDVVNGNGVLHVCGLLAPFAGIGAACGIGSGHSGSGSVVSSNGDTLLIDDLRWQTAVGDMIPFEADTTSTKAGPMHMAGYVRLQGFVPCLSKEAQNFTIFGQYALVPPVPPLPPVDVTNCSHAGVLVDEVDFTVGSAHTSVSIYQGPAHVEVCVVVTEAGATVVDESVTVSTEPPPPPPPPAEVDADAPPGDEGTTPCDVQQFEGGSTSTRVYIRTSSGTSPAFACVGVRSDGTERHVRVKVE